MKMNSDRLRSASALQALAVTALLCVPVLGHAEPVWPKRPITLIVPFPPGGGADQLGRTVAERLSLVLKQPVIVDNRPGAGGMVGSAVAARAAPDGYTFLLGSMSNVLNHFTYRKLPYDFGKDFTAVAQLVQMPNYLAVGPQSPLNSLQDVIAHARKHPREVSCANAGVGTSPYLSCELLAKVAGVEITNVPYKGGAQAIQDTMSGQTSMVVSSEVLPFIADRRLKAIAVTSSQRSPLSPDIPSVKESLSGLEVVSWFGVFAPSGVPQPIVQRISNEAVTAINSPEVQPRLAALAMVPMPRGQDEFSAYLSAEYRHWGDFLKPLNIRLD